ncbi:hypothetical protein E2C01_047819 [Portunus trituberculatus]|uniref:Uncharacterized protein n=1 Tax=Portunus trituberculatus TaxID=210409 RepID=A0A5B7G8W9_PORTR|nr:hypothetical protein [Portunus trituberculatus]
MPTRCISDQQFTPASLAVAATFLALIGQVAWNAAADWSGIGQVVMIVTGDWLRVMVQLVQAGWGGLKEGLGLAGGAGGLLSTPRPSTPSPYTTTGLNARDSATAVFTVACVSCRRRALPYSQFR